MQELPTPFAHTGGVRFMSKWMWPYGKTPINATKPYL
jgi:hypothetical protein